MNIELTPELERFVNGVVESGRYNSASGVVREALRRLKEHDSEPAARLAEFNEQLGGRLAPLDCGEVIASAAARSRIERKSAQRRRFLNGRAQ